MPAPFSWSLFEKMPVVGILRNVPPKHIETIAALYLDNGFTTIEITINSPGASEAIANLEQKYGGQLNIGAGTVCTLADLNEAVSAGANFIVTPVINEVVIEATVAQGLPIFPGAFTPSEIYKAWTLGASMVKIFPATLLGPEFIKDVLAPLPYLKLLPTGGVNAENFSKFLIAGAKGAGVGSTLFPSQIIKEENWKELANGFQKWHANKEFFPKNA